MADRRQQQGCLWEEAEKDVNSGLTMFWSMRGGEGVVLGEQTSYAQLSAPSTKASGQMNCWQSLYSYLDSSPPAPRNLHTPIPRPPVVRSEDPRMGHVGQQMLS